VKVVYAGQGVRVETSGVALNSGDLGSEVSVRVMAGRRIVGRVIGFDAVEVER
jgi:flagella basal body P-ring formation protein FlgA